MTLTLKNGDCLKLMKEIPDKSIDLMICDLPYGETNCKWDTCIDMEEFWTQFRRIRKSKRVACLHFCSAKFGYSLIKSWEEGFKMDMVWKKRNKTGGLQSRHRPMRNHELIYFFYEQAPKYNRDKYHKRINNLKFGESECVNGIEEHNNNNKYKIMTNFEPVQPASVLEENTIMDCKEYGTGKHYGYAFGQPAGAKWDPVLPVSVLDTGGNEVWFASDVPESQQPKYAIDLSSLSLPDENEPHSIFESQKCFVGKRHHQTEKPQDILEFFIKYWSDEGDTILDPTMGSGSTGVACKRLGRNFIGYELNESIFKKAEERIKSVKD